jgi:hypothetical protein
MEVEEKNMVRVILEDVKSLKGKVGGVLGTLVGIYTDVFYEAKEEYWVKLEKIRKEVEIGEADKKVRFLDIGHHDEIYRKKH